jgi:nucleotide-binding universal stress UspA family protein
MGFKHLLVYVDNDPACSSRVDVAAALAAQYEAYLTGLHALGWPPPMGYYIDALPLTFLEEEKRQREELARQAELRFHERTRRWGIHAEWRVEIGDIIGTTKLHARYADLTIVGQGIDFKDGPQDLAFLPAELVLGVGRPVLVVPRYGTFDTLAKRVLIAWNGSREATRAVHDALPLLKLAKAVTVFSIDPEHDTGERIPSADIAHYLARHGVTAEGSSTPGLDMSTGDLLLSRAADISADLIVMGAYGHSRFRELVLGGATRYILQHMTVPVLMSH